MRPLSCKRLLHCRTFQPFGRLHRAVQVRAGSSIVTAWGAYVGQFASPSQKPAEIDSGAYPLEKYACAAPTRLSLEKMFGFNLADAGFDVTAVGAGVRHAIVSFCSPNKDGYTSVLAGIGLNRCHQLGARGSTSPVVTRIAGKVNQIACGREHSAFIVKGSDGTTKVMVCGNNSYGQLGIGSNEQQQQQQSLSGANRKRVDKPQLQAHVLQEISAMENILIAGEIPVKLQCGMDHTVILTSMGRVFTMGWGSDGQLGAGPKSTASFDRPVQVFGLGNIPITDIASSTDFTLALSTDNRLFYWGNAEYGQCMTGEKIDQVLVPIEVPFDGGRIAGIAAGGCHALVLTVDGRVNTCGYGALGLGSSTVSLLKTSVIQAIKDIVFIAASTDRCLAVDSRGYVYSWGLGNRAGRLGTGLAFGNVHVPQRLDIDPALVEPSLIALGNDIALMAKPINK
ncbi:hypothetical protein GGI25_003915 [Coemansia spiralis]|uniref:Uncharacterized protein n=2 Tax=Coemansia TaxID=4863 RepID=A0A9W8G5E9_9FUNG|nr:hypothetical protein EDC05_004979 [Coemansia umbellata]KAJ2620926.1 hypothetical protein GGI26_004532 [Coemansia sp. RSA 1358]KAJ2675498.1 hypothetical protein GGI25_003915 [Coemansia spiralis]